MILDLFLKVIFNPKTTNLRRSGKWDQVIIALCGIVENPEEIVSKLARIDPLLAVDCLQSGIVISLEQVIDDFIEASESEDADLRNAAITALGLIGDDKIISILIQALDDVSKSVNEFASDALVKFGKLAVQPLIKHLRETTDEKAVYSINALSQIGKQSHEFLISAASQETNTLIKLRLFTTMIRMRHVDFIPILQSYMSLEDENLRQISIEGIGIIGNSASTQLLIDHLDNTKNNISHIASIASALGNIGDPIAIPTLIDLLTDEEWPIHISAYLALKKINTSESLVPVNLFDSLQARKREDLIFSVKLLQNSFGTIGLLHALKHHNKANWQIGKTLSQISDDEMPLVLHILKKELALKKEDFPVYPIKDELSNIIPDFRVESRYRNLGQSSTVLGMIAYAIGLRGDPKYAPELVPLLQYNNHNSHYVLGIAIESIGKLKYAKATKELLNSLSNNMTIFFNSKELVCDRAAEALLQVSTEEIRVTIREWAMQEIKGRINQDRLTPIIILGKIGDSNAIPRLKTIAKYKNYMISYKAEEAIKKIANRERQ